MREKIITPYWQRLSQFFLFPLRPPAIVVSIAYAVLGLILARAGLIFFLLSLVLHLALIKYAYATLSFTAQGLLRPPPLSREVIIEGYELPFKQGLVFLLLLQLAYALSRHLSENALLLLVFAFWLVLPANVMVLASTRSFLNSLNPALLLSLILRLGWHYLALYALLVCLYIAWANVQSWLWQRPTMTTGLTFLASWSSAYYLLVMFHLMGYVLYQFHEAIGVDIGSADEAEDKNAQDQRFALFEKFMEQENYPAAADELKYHIEQQPTDSALHLKLHRVLQLSGDQRELCQHGRYFIRLLLSLNKKQQALAVYDACVTADPEFTLLEDTYRELIEMMRLAGRSREALRLVARFAERHADSELLPMMLLLAARIALEDLCDNSSAKAWLDRLQQRFPEHTVQVQAQIYRKLIKS